MEKNIEEKEELNLKEKENVNVEMKETKHPKSKLKATDTDGRLETFAFYSSSSDSAESSQQQKVKTKTSIYFNYLLGQLIFELLLLFETVVLGSDSSSSSWVSTQEVAFVKSLFCFLRPLWSLDFE